jgi:hypothetical protein
MPVPFACPLRLTDDERQGLESLARAHATPQALAFRCRLILRAAAPDAPPNLRVAADMPCHRQTGCLSELWGRWAYHLVTHSDRSCFSMQNGHGSNDAFARVLNSGTLFLIFLVVNIS